MHFHARKQPTKPPLLCCNQYLSLLNNNNKDLMVNPVITSTGLSYEKSLLDDHVKANGQVDPTTRARIDPSKYIESTNLRLAI